MSWRKVKRWRKYFAACKFNTTDNTFLGWNVAADKNESVRNNSGFNYI